MESAVGFLEALPHSLGAARDPAMTISPRELTGGLAKPAVAEGATMRPALGLGSTAAAFLFIAGGRGGGGVPSMVHNIVVVEHVS